MRRSARLPDTPLPSLLHGFQERLAAEGFA